MLDHAEYLATTKKPIATLELESKFLFANARATQKVAVLSFPALTGKLPAAQPATKLRQVADSEGAYLFANASTRGDIIRALVDAN